MINAIQVLRAATIATLVLLLPQTTFAGQMTPVTAPLTAPQDNAVLQVRGDGSTRNITLSEIETLDHFEITMNAPGGISGTFSGVRMIDLLAHLGFSDAKRLHFRAIDDYKVTVEPAREPAMDQILFVTRLDGKSISISDKGPFRLIWANEAETAEAGTTSTVKWIWSIAEIRKVR